MRKGVGRTRNFAYLGVLPHASLVAVGAPHYLAKESLANCTRIVAVAASGPDTRHEIDLIVMRLHPWHGWATRECAYRMRNVEKASGCPPTDVRERWAHTKRT